MTQDTQYHHTESNPNLEITSWGGEYIYIHDLADDHGIMLLLHEVDDVIRALQEAKAAQEKPEKLYEETERLRLWNVQAVKTYKPI